MRCAICDFSEHGGSYLTGRPPGKNNPVRFNAERQEFLCKECATSIAETLIGYEPIEETNEG